MVDRSPHGSPYGVGGASRRSSSPSRLAASMLALVLLPVPAIAAALPGGDTPQAVTARMREAAQKDDFPGLVDCIAPAARRELAAGLVLGTTMMVAFLDMGSEMAMGMAQGVAEGMGEAAGAKPTAEQQAQMDKAKQEAKRKAAELREQHQAILSRYGLQQRMEALQAQGEAAGGGSPEEAIASLLAGVDERALVVDLMKFMESIGKSQGGSGKKPMELPPEVTDYKIEGDHATAKAGDETIHFVRVDGRWYMEPEAKKAPTPGLE